MVLRPSGTVTTHNTPAISYPTNIRKAASYIVVYHERLGRPAPKTILPYLLKILNHLTDEELENHRARGLPVKYNLDRSITQVKNYVKTWCEKNFISVTSFLKEDSLVPVPSVISPTRSLSSHSSDNPVYTQVEYPVHSRADNPVHRRDDLNIEEINASLVTKEHRFIAEVDSDGDALFEEADTGLTVKPSTQVIHRPKLDPTVTSTSSSQHTQAPTSQRLDHYLSASGPLAYRNPTVQDEADDKSTIYDSSSHYSSGKEFNDIDTIADQLGKTTIEPKADIPMSTEITMGGDEAEQAAQIEAASTPLQLSGPSTAAAVPQVESIAWQKQPEKIDRPVSPTPMFGLNKPPRQQGTGLIPTFDFHGPPHRTPAPKITTSSFDNFRSRPRQTPVPPLQTTSQQSYPDHQGQNQGSEQLSVLRQISEQMEQNNKLMTQFGNALQHTMSLVQSGNSTQNENLLYTQQIYNQQGQQQQPPGDNSGEFNGGGYNNPSGYDRSRRNQNQNQRQQQQNAPQHPNHRIQMKPEMVGIFEPSSLEDTTAAKIFMDAIDDSVAADGEEQTLGVLRRCIRGDTAVSWKTSLCDADKVRMRTSTKGWKDILERDFFPRKAVRLMTANKEVFRWNQNRKPLDYATEKARLLRIAGIKDEDEIVEQIHAGFINTPELFGNLENCIMPNGGNTVSGYRMHVARHQDAAKSAHDLRNGSYSNRNYANRFGTSGTKESSASTDKDKQLSGGTVKPGDKRRSSNGKRSRPCRWCQGEHWDYECDKRGKGDRPRVSAYYAHMGKDNIHTDMLFEMDENEDIEKEYEELQKAFFAASYLEDNTTTAVAYYVHSDCKRDDVYTCEACGLEYPTRNKLYVHRSSAGHDNTPPVVVSDVPMPNDPTADLADYHFAQVKMRNSEKGPEKIACIDCGYGNSAVDEEYLRTIDDVLFLPLPKPVSVQGIGGGLVQTKEVAMLSVFMRTRCGFTIKFVRPFHIFPNLGIPLLIGNDIMQPERMTVSYKAEPTLIVGSCKDKRVALKVMDKPPEVKRAVCRTTERTVIEPHHTSMVPVTVNQSLPAGSCYLLTPSRTRSAKAGGCGAPHSFVSHDQRLVPMTNFTDSPVTVYKGTVIGSVSSCEKEGVEWKEAAAEVTEGYLGVGRPKANLSYFGREQVTKTWEAPGWVLSEYTPVY